MTKIIRFLFLLLFIFTPLVFTSTNSELFELPKMYFIYSVTSVIIFFHSINVIKNRQPFYLPHRLNLFLFLFIVSQIISTLFSIDLHTSFFGYYSRLNGGLLSLIYFFCLFLILPVYLNQSFLQKIVSYSLTVGGLVSVYAILQHLGIDKDYWVQDVQARVFSTFGQPNWLAAYLCILLPFALHHPKYQKFLPFVFYLALLFTKSKTGLIAAIISLAIYFLFNFKSKFKLLITVYSLLITLSLIINNPIRDFIFPSKSPTPVSETTTLNITPSENIRQIVWQGAINLWHRFPLIGTGPETFAYTYYWVRPVAHNLTSEWDFLYNKVHNEYLNYLSNTGLFGLLTYSLFILASLYHLRQQPHFLTAFISILITNFAGFSISVVSLFFFLLPLFSLSPNLTKPPRPISLISSLILIFVSLFSLFYHFKFFQADLSFAQAERFDSQDKYLQSYQSLIKSYQLNSHEPTYLSRLSVVSAKIALAYHLQKNDNLATTFSQNAIIFSDHSLQISPFNLNLYKERAQALSYLIGTDTLYQQLLLDTLNHTISLAPTDAKSYYLLSKFDSPEKNLIKALELKPNYDHAYFDLGVYYFNQKNYPLAKTNFENSLKYAPNNQSALDYLEKINKSL